MNYDDLSQQYQQFLDWLSQTQPMSDDQLASASGAIPGIEMFMQFNQSQQDNDLKKMQVEYGLAQLQNDFDMNSMQLEQARKQLEFQSGPYQDYLNQKTANDMAMSNNDVLRSNNDVTQSNNNVLMSKDAVTRSGNDTLQSGYSLQAAQAQAAADKIKAYTAMGFLNPTHFANMNTVAR